MSKYYKTLVTFFLFACLMALQLTAQDMLTISNSVDIKGNASLVVKGSILGCSGTSGEISNDGTIILTGNWTNNASFSFLNGTGEILFKGASASQNIDGTETTGFYDLTIDNIHDIVLEQDMFVDNTLSLINGDLDLKNSVADLGTTGMISGESEATRIKLGDVVNNTGTIQATRLINNVANYNPANLGVLISNNTNMGDITIIRGHQLQYGTGTFSGNTSIARFFEMRNPSNELIDFEVNAVNAISLNYWDAELNGQNEASLAQYQWVSESTESWWTPLLGSINTSSNVSTPNANPYSDYFDEPIWYTMSFGGKYTLASKDNPLPVVWLSFTANWHDETYSRVDIHWETASETNADFYELQRSEDMSSWKHIHTIDANGFTSQASQYSYLDTNPPKHTETFYYRLKQVDYDGNYEYSNMVKLAYPDEGFEIISIFPNPAKDEINLQIISELDTRIAIYIWDKLGQTVLLQQEKIRCGINEIQIDISYLAPALYTIQLITDTGNHKTSRQFIK